MQRLLPAAGGWTEAATTWANRPALGEAVASTGGFSAATWVDVDLTAALLAGAPPEFAITTPGETQIRFSSREGTRPPQLRLSFAPAAH